MRRPELMENEAAREIAQRCIQRKAFYAHSENILFVKLASSQKTDRRNAVQTVIEDRTNHIDEDSAHLF